MLLWKNFLFAAAEASFDNAIIVTFGVIGIAVLGWRVDMLFVIDALLSKNVMISIVYFEAISKNDLNLKSVASEQRGGFGDR